MDARTDDTGRPTAGQMPAGDRPRWPTVIGLALAVGLAAAALPRLVSPLHLAESRVDDVRIAAFTPVEPQNERIVIVGITEDTLAGLPYRSPLDRAFIADLISHLDAAGVTAIGLDLLLDQPTEPEKDAALLAALEGASVPVVVATAIAPYPLTERQQAFLETYVGTVPQGFVNLLTDGFDNAVRRFLPERDGSLSFAAALATELGADPPSGSQDIAWHGSPDQDTAPFPIYPAHAAHLLPTDWFAGRVALIGPVLPSGGGDLHNTPLRWRDGSIPGVVIHAHVLAQLLEGREAPRGGFIVTTALAGMMALAGVAVARLTLAWPLKLLGGLVIVAAVWAATTLWFQAGGPLVPVVLASVALPVAAGVDTALTGRRVRAQRRFIRDAFTRYVSPAVVSRLEQDPAALRLAGERRDCTFLFTDLMGFTGLTERLAPEVLTTLLNAYLDGMTSVVLAHEGTLDKFVGDAVIALFNAPELQPDHAERAVGCALALNRFAQTFEAEQAKHGISLGRTRIGVHTGTATIGNFGGSHRFQYTAVGDAVNTASRLEGANRHLGTAICVSGDTAQRCAHLRFRPVGDLVLPGKSTPIAAFEPLAESRDTLAAAYAPPFAMLSDNGADPAATIAAFEALVAASPNDPLARFHLDRLKRGAWGTRIVLTQK